MGRFIWFPNRHTAQQDRTANTAISEKCVAKKPDLDYIRVTKKQMAYKSVQYLS